LFAGNLQTASAVNLEAISNYSIYLSISPSTIEEDANLDPFGYVYIVNKNGIPITSDSEVEITLTSDNPKIASVPEKITFPANGSYAKFQIDTKDSGTTTITASLNDKIDFKDIMVGSQGTFLPDDAVLELNLPTSNMHVNSEMPFSVYLRTSEGVVIRAPFDIEIELNYEKNLATPNTEKLVIKQGEIQATQPDAQIDAVKNISISSTFPTDLDIMIYPELIPAETDRTLDIFVTLLDSDGNPTVAPRDIPLDFFSDEQDYVGDDLDDSMKETKMVIKKGEFGFRFTQNLKLKEYPMLEF
jgi:hypothetical protein